MIYKGVGWAKAPNGGWWWAHPWAHYRGESLPWQAPRDTRSKWSPEPKEREFCRHRRSYWTDVTALPRWAHSPPGKKLGEIPAPRPHSRPALISLFSAVPRGNPMRCPRAENTLDAPLHVNPSRGSGQVDGGPGEQTGSIHHRDRTAFSLCRFRTMWMCSLFGE